jgi:hypothetical protein
MASEDELVEWTCYMLFTLWRAASDSVLYGESENIIGDAIDWIVEELRIVF